MTNEELQRVREYASKIKATDGNLGILTLNESRDLDTLLRKWLVENKDPAPVIQSR